MRLMIVDDTSADAGQQQELSGARPQRGSGHRSVFADRTILTLDDLQACGVSRTDVYRHCPHAVERIGLDGRPCWSRDDLAPLCGLAEVG